MRMDLSFLRRDISYGLRFLLEHVIFVICIMSCDLTIKAEADYNYLYGNSIAQTSGRVMLHKRSELKPMVVRAIVMYCEAELISTVRVQLWYQVDNSVNYTLDWQKTVYIDGRPGRNVVPLQPDEYFTSTRQHRLGFYCERDPCPILYAFSTFMDTVMSLSSFTSQGGPYLKKSETFEELQLPMRFALAVCNKTDCDALPLPTTSTQLTITTTHIPQSQAPTEATSIFLQERVIIGLLAWLITLTFLIVSMCFLLICLHFRPKQKQHQNDDGHKPGDWFIVVEDSNMTKGVTNPVYNNSRPGSSNVNGLDTISYRA